MRRFALAGTLALAGALALAACASPNHLFSSYASAHPDQSRPVARIETRGGVELGATTSEGVLLLGRTADAGPCRVHYFLGETPLIEDATIQPWGGVYFRADLDLKHQRAPLLARELRDEDVLVALHHDGRNAVRVGVTRAHDPRVQGDVLAWPGRTLMAGTPVFVFEEEEDVLRFVGLVAGEVTVGDDRFLAFTGLDRLREAMATPRAQPQTEYVKYRPDDIAVRKVLR